MAGSQWLVAGSTWLTRVLHTCDPSSPRSPQLTTPSHNRSRLTQGPVLWPGTWSGPEHGVHHMLEWPQLLMTGVTISLIWLLNFLNVLGRNFIQTYILLSDNWTCSRNCCGVSPYSISTPSSVIDDFLVGSSMKEQYFLLFRLEMKAKSLGNENKMI